LTRSTTSPRTVPKIRVVTAVGIRAISPSARTLPVSTFVAVAVSAARSYAARNALRDAR
jgi:hypothetical protein